MGEKSILLKDENDFADENVNTMKLKLKGLILFYVFYNSTAQKRLF